MRDRTLVVGGGTRTARRGNSRKTGNSEVVPDFRETGKVIAPKSISAITSFTRPCQFEMLN